MAIAEDTPLLSKSLIHFSLSPKFDEIPQTKVLDYDPTNETLNQNTLFTLSTQNKTLIS